MTKIVTYWGKTPHLVLQNATPTLPLLLAGAVRPTNKGCAARKVTPNYCQQSWRFLPKAVKVTKIVTFYLKVTKIVTFR